MKNKGKLDTTTLLMIGLIAALLIWRHFGSGKVETPSNENGEGGDVDEDREEDNKNPNLNVTVKVGSKGDAVKQCQERANTTILLVRKNFKLMQDANVEQSILQHAMNVSRLTTLKVDGIFGEKTRKVVQTLTGSNQTSLYTLRKKYANWKNIIDNADKSDLSSTGYPWWPW